MVVVVGDESRIPRTIKAGYQQVLREAKNDELRHEVWALRRRIARLETSTDGDSHLVDHSEDGDKFGNPFSRAGGEQRFRRRGAELLRSFGANLKIPDLTNRVQLQRFRAGKLLVRSWATMKNSLLRKFYFKNFQGEADESRCMRQPIRCFKCHVFGHIQTECPNFQFITVIEFKCPPECNEYHDDSFESGSVDDIDCENQMDDNVRASNLDEMLVADITRKATMNHHNEEDNTFAIQLDSPPVYDIYPDESTKSGSTNELVPTYQPVLRTFDVTRFESKLEYASLMPINKCGFATAHKLENKVENQTTCADVIYSGLNFGKGLIHVSTNALVLSVIASTTERIILEHGDVLFAKLLGIVQCNKFEMGSYLHLNSQVTLENGGHFKMGSNYSINLIKFHMLLVEILGIFMKLGVANMINKLVETRFVFLAINRSVFKHRKKRLFSVTNFSSIVSNDTAHADSWSSLLQQEEYDADEKPGQAFDRLSIK
ncbi:hypothetical protein CASFOL_014256 [Castilleja foliolosa]|uniref:CCHC-type domain-containing protein n=1 Tax=Castilleja foliolosa TaxID=1961234 RepID=A0ABD3DP30_9LAMI